MRWKDFLTTEYKKLDITLEKTSDVQFLSLLHNAWFDPTEIRYARKRLVIPIKDRTTWEWADFDTRRKRIVYAENGAIYAIDLRRADLKERLLHDFNDMKFEALTAPY